MATKDRVITFRPDADVFEAMLGLRERVGVPYSEQIRRALRAWLEAEGAMKPARKRADTRKRA